MDNCYLCGRDGASQPLGLKDSFTDHNKAQCPESKKFCERCHWALGLRCFYWNAGANKWSPIWGRNWSWLLSQGESFPQFTGETHSDGKLTLPVVNNLPTRSLIREWLLNPPEPPFTIAVAESGQKHILPWAKEACSRDCFPVQFEHDSLYINASIFRELVATYESLMGMDFYKSEIDTGNFHSQKLMKVVGNDDFWHWDAQIAVYRGTRLLQLVSYIATKDEGVVS